MVSQKRDELIGAAVKTNHLIRVQLPTFDCFRSKKSNDLCWNGFGQVLRHKPATLTVQANDAFLYRSVAVSTGAHNDVDDGSAPALPLR
jgi:hypothetical protein